MRIDNPETVFEYWAHRYVAHMNTHGRKFSTPKWHLNRLCEFLADQGAEDIDRRLFEQWCARNRRLNANVRRSQQLLVGRLCRYRQRTEAECFIPDASRFAKRRPHRAPVILWPSDIERLLIATDTLKVHGAVPLRPAMLRVGIVLLYSAGLRRGELLRLQLGDIDLANGTAMIRDTKFYKSRIVPLAQDAQRELRRYLKKRLVEPWNVSPNAPLIGFHRHTKIIQEYGTGFGAALRSLCIQADVRDADSRLPTVHDFRHSFAAQALLRWYREGADVQSCLPKLAMYMGHASIVSAAYYLHWLPEVARMASNQFERRYGHILPGEIQ